MPVTTSTRQDPESAHRDLAPASGISQDGLRPQGAAGDSDCECDDCDCPICSPGCC